MYERLHMFPRVGIGYQCGLGEELHKVLAVVVQRGLTAGPVKFAPEEIRIAPAPGRGRREGKRRPFVAFGHAVTRWVLLTFLVKLYRIFLDFSRIFVLHFQQTRLTASEFSLDIPYAILACPRSEEHTSELQSRGHL